MTEQKINSPAVGDGDLKRSLSNRHLQLIAIGGAIGTGLFMGSGKTISLAGPSILFIYMIIGLMFFFNNLDTTKVKTNANNPGNN